MANLTTEQIEQKKLLLAEKVNEMKSLYKELVEAGAIELSDEDLDKAAGGYWFFGGERIPTPIHVLPGMEQMVVPPL